MLYSYSPQFWVGGQSKAPAALFPGTRHSMHCTGSWVGIGADLNWSGKSPRPPPGFETGPLGTFTNIMLALIQTR
jgi:hypothetical protein